MLPAANHRDTLPSDCPIASSSEAVSSIGGGTKSLRPAGVMAGDDGSIRRRADGVLDDGHSAPSVQVVPASTNKRKSLSLDRRADIGPRCLGSGHQDEHSLRFRRQSVLVIFSLVQTLLLVLSVVVFVNGGDAFAQIKRNACRLPFGDVIRRSEDGYSIWHGDQAALLTRRQNGTVLEPSPCHFRRDVIEGDKLARYECQSQTFLYHGGRRYFAFRLFRRRKNDAVEHVLIQGPLSDVCGDWLVEKPSATCVQTVSRIDLNTGRITLGYPPIPLRERHHDGATLYVDGAAVVATSL